jgi:hypothetical protein
VPSKRKRLEWQSGFGGALFLKEISSSDFVLSESTV